MNICYNKIINELRKIYIILIISFKDWSSYRMTLLSFLINTLLGALSYAYLGKTVIFTRSVEYPSELNYLSYVIVGMMVYTFINSSISIPTRIVNPWILENLMLTPTNYFTILIGFSLWHYFLDFLVILIYFFIGYLFLIQYKINIILLSLTIFLSTMILMGFGLIAAGIQILIKKWNPIIWLTSTLTIFLGGIYYPPSIIPVIGSFSKIIPQYYITIMFRKAILYGNIDYIPYELYILLFSALFFFPFGYYIFNLGINIARKKGIIGNF